MNKTSDSRNGQKIYVGIVATSTLLLIGLFLWPLSVREFRTTAMFKLKYDPESGVEKTILNEWVVDALREETGRNAIADILSRMESMMTSSVLNSMDPGQIREAIHIQGRPGAFANSVEYRLSLVGEGSADEVEFINMVVARINRQLDLQLAQANNQQVVKSLARDFGEFHDSRLAQLSARLSDVIDQLTTNLNDVRIVSRNLENLSPAGSSSQNVFGRPQTAELEMLKAERQQLLDQQGLTEYHPQVMAIQQQIERLMVTGESTNTSATGVPGSMVSVGSGQIVTNRFTANPASPGASRETGQQVFTASVNQIVEEIRMIDLAGTRKSLAAVQETLDNPGGTDIVVQRLNQRAIEELDYQSPVSLADFQLARRSSPIGGSPTTSQFFGLLLLAGMFGSVVALNYDPALRKRPFRSVEQLQRKLQVPVIGVLRNRASQAQRPFHKLMAARTVQLCEWTLLGLAVLLILAALANSEVAAAFIENPFYGITETIWLISPNH
jgi:hypothetical protein